MEGLVQPVLQRMTYDEAALGQYGNADYWAQTLYDFLVGAAMGGLGSGVETAQNRLTGRTAGAEAPTAQATTQEGNDTTPVQNAPQGAADSAGAYGYDAIQNILSRGRVNNTDANMEGTEQTSRLASSMPYNQWQEAATGLSREDYAKIFRYESQTEEKSLHLAEELVYVMKDGHAQQQQKKRRHRRTRVNTGHSRAFSQR